MRAAGPEAELPGAEMAQMRPVEPDDLGSGDRHCLAPTMEGAAVPGKKTVLGLLMTATSSIRNGGQGVAMGQHLLLFLPE